MNSTAQTAAAPSTTASSHRLQWQMLIGFVGGLVLGLIVYATGGGAPWIKEGVETVTTYITGPIGQIFLRLLFMLVIPLLFSALVVGVAVVVSGVGEVNNGGGGQCLSRQGLGVGCARHVPGDTMGRRF